MRGQCGIAVVAATLVTTGTSIHSSTSTARDAVLAPLAYTIPVGLRRKVGSGSAARKSAPAAIERNSEGQATLPPDGAAAQGSSDDWATTLPTPKKARSKKQSESCPPYVTSCSSMPSSPSPSQQHPAESSQQQQQASRDGARRQRPRQRDSFASLSTVSSEEAAGSIRPRNAAAAAAGATTALPASMKALLSMRAGGVAGAWFAGRGGNGAGGDRGNNPYNEFPDDFDYDAEGEEEMGDVESEELCWPDEDAAVSEEGAAQDSFEGDLEQEEEDEEGRRRSDRLSSVGFKRDRGGWGGSRGGEGERATPSAGYLPELGRCGCV